MLELVHATAGGIIAYKIGSPLLSLPLAFLSHFVLDTLPHWNPNLSREKKKQGRISTKTMFVVFFDCLIGLFLGLKIASLALPDVNKAIFVIFGCFAGILPDLVEAPYLIKFQGSHQWNVPFVWGIAFQLLYLFVLFYFL